jgi:hypothetical protein
LPDPYFILLQIDYFIHQPVHVRQIKVLEKYLGVDNVVKIDLSADRFHDLHRPYATEGDMKIIESDQQAQYRSSLQAAIWTRDYFASILTPNRSPWEFEVTPTPRASVSTAIVVNAGFFQRARSGGIHSWVLTRIAAHSKAQPHKATIVS